MSFNRKVKKKKVWNVLVFPGGTENGLEINKSLRYSKEVKLFSASNNSQNHAEYIFERHFIIPDIKNKKCLTKLNNLIIRKKIDFLFPSNSLVIDFLIANRKKIKCKVIQPEDNIVKTTRSKKEIYKIFKDKLSIPATYDRKKLKRKNFPVFIKPNSSYGSKGARKISSLNELESLDINFSEYLICEFLPGKEFTIECFSTKTEGVLYCMARSRERVRMGTSMYSKKASEKIQKESKKIAEIIFKNLNISGLWFFQLKINSDNKLSLLEIETRVAGTMALSRSLGINLPLANLYLEIDKPFSFKQQGYEIEIDRSLSNRYKTNIKYNTVYLDLDETIIVKGKINTEIMKFIYQCINEKKKLVLISKSLEKDKIKFLKKFKLENLFNQIIWLKENESKSKYIKDKKSIFIDDSFLERREVEEKCKIHSFDPNMIEVLINDRI